VLAERTRQIEDLKESMQQQALQDVREYLLAGAENSTLKTEIKDLHS
jgi:hypothetical protein